MMHPRVILVILMKTTVKCQLEYAGDMIHFKYAPMYSPQFSADSGGGSASPTGRGGISRKIINHSGVFSLYPLFTFDQHPILNFSSHHFSDEKPNHVHV